MQRNKLIFLIMCIINIKNINCEIKSSILENIPIRGLLFNETVQGTNLEDDSSGYFNESGSGNEDSDFGNQLQVPTDFKDIWEEDIELKGTNKFGSGNGKEDEGPSGRGLFDTVKDSDLYIESSGDSQVESQSYDHTVQPVTKDGGHVHPLTRQPIGSVPRNGHHPYESEHDILHAPQICEENECTPDHHHDVKIVSTGGNVLPSSVTMVIHCTVRSFVNDSVNLMWSLPEFDSMWNHSVEILESISNKERITVGVFRLYNLSEADSGIYNCKAVFSERCCYRNATTNIKVYTPPSIAADIAIVLAVCFIELVMIIYFKTRSDKKCKNTSDRSQLPYKELPLLQSKT